PTRQEVTDRLLLPREAAPLALVLPLRWIAPQPAPHGSKLIASPGAGEPFRCEWCEFVASLAGGCGGRGRLGRFGEVVTSAGQPPPTSTNLPFQCPKTFVSPTIPPAMLMTTQRKRRLSPMPAPSFGTTS